MKPGVKPPAPEHVDDVIETICAGLSDGTPQAVILRANPGLPDKTTIRMWSKNNPEIEARIREARFEGYDMIAYRLRAVARGKHEDSTGDVQRDKLIVWTDLQLLAKWDPKRYGDRVQVDSTVKHEAADLETMQTQLVTQVTMNPTLRPVLENWARGLLAKLEETT